MVLVLFLRVDPVTGVVLTLDIKHFIGGLTSINVCEEVFGHHYV